MKFNAANNVDLTKCGTVCIYLFINYCSWKFLSYYNYCV